MHPAFQKQTSATPNVQEFKNAFWEEMFDILGWWSTHMVDDVHGGFYGRMDGSGHLFPQADKGIILNTRILWTYAAAALATGHSPFHQLADRAFQYLCDHFWDDTHGGVFWAVDFFGKPTDNRKQIYAQAFAIFALSEYYFLTKNEEALDKAKKLFWLIEQYSRDKVKNGYISAFSHDWSNMDDIRLSEKDMNEPKIMNTHLHILEAYMNFYRVMPSAALGKALGNCIMLFLDHFFNPETASLHIYFNETWKPIGHERSYGHNIEASWMLMEAAELLGNSDLLKRVGQVSIQLAESVLDEAVDSDGAIFNEGSKGGITDTDKHWWPQAEAVVGFWNAFEMTGDSEFARASSKCWDFIREKLADQKHGEWHWRTDIQGNPILSEDKAGPWKAPYHNGRMCIEMLRRLR
jgi:mannobiose 2-epimerase